MLTLKRFDVGSVLAVLSALFISVNAYAQFGGRAPDGGRGNRDRGGDARPGGTRTTEAPRIDLFEVTMHELREDLKLTPTQQPAWDAYENKVRALAADLKRDRSRKPVPDDEPKTAPQRIDRLVDVARNRLAALEEIADAVRSLYGGLTPEQRAIADARLATALPNMGASVAAGTPPSEMRDGGREGRTRAGAP